MPSERKASILSQIVMTFCSQTTGYVVAILTGIVVARTLGPAGKGLATYASLLLAVFATFATGLQTTIMYQCGRNMESSTLVYGAALRIVGFTMLPISAAFVAYGVLQPAHVVFAFLGCALPFAVYNQVSTGFLLLKNDVRSTVILGAFNTFGVAIFTVPALLIFHGGLTAVLTVWAAMFVTSGVYSFVRVGRYVPRFSVSTTLATLREQMWFSLKSGGVSVADFLNLRVDVFVVGAMLDARSLGIYSLAVATGELMWQISRPLTWTMTGRVAVADRERAAHLTATATRNILAVELIAGALIFAFAPMAVQYVYGPAYAESGQVVRWLMPGLILYAAHGPLGFFVIVKEGKPLTILAIQATSVVACAVVTALTIHRFGIYGAALATVSTYTFAAGVKAWLFMRYSGCSLREISLLNSVDVVRFRDIARKAFRGRVVVPASATSHQTS